MEDQTTLRLPVFQSGGTIKRVLQPSLCVGLVYILLIGFFILVRHESIMDFVHLGTVWGEHNPAGSWGYDGQFYYQIALHPLNAAQYMDNAPYRYQRILYPLVAWALSLGQASLVPYALLLINFVAIVGSIEILARLLQRHGLSPWFSLAFGLYYGQAIGLTFDTAEPFSCLLICLGLWYLNEKKLLISAIWLGLAGLARETAVIFPLCFALTLLWQRQWKDALGFLVFSVLPLILFLLLLVLLFGKTGVTFSPPFEHVPFAGIFAYRNTPHKFWLLVICILIPTVINLAFLIWELVHRRWNIATLAWVVNLAMIIFLSHESYLELVSSGRICTSLVLATLFYAIKSRNNALLFALQIYILTFALYFIGTLLHLDSFLG